MIKHVVESLGSGAVYFVGGSWVEIDPPPHLSVGDEVEIQISGISRQSISWMRWIDEKGESHFIRYDIDGYPILSKPPVWTPASIMAAGMKSAGLVNTINAREARRNS